MDAALLALAGWLETTGFGPWSRSEPWTYPVANILHLLGLVMLVGGIGIVDLRIVGFWRSLPLRPLSAALTPVAMIGLTVLALSGSVLFAADGKTLAGSPVFHLKLGLVLAGLTNAVVFRLWMASAANWTAPPPLARLSAAGSLVLWLATGTAGRLIAYY